MKRTPRHFAQVLVDLLQEAPDVAARKTVIRHFLSFLYKKRSLKLLPRIVLAFETLWAERSGERTVTLTSVQGLSPQKLSYLAKEFSEALGGRVTIAPQASKGVLAGFRARISDAVIDGTMARRLGKLHHHFLS